MSPGLQSQTSEPTMWRLINFYDPTINGLDALSRKLAEILEWTDDSLERQHNYIQFLFPLPEESRFYIAPIVDEDTMLIFHNSPALQQNMVHVLKRMLTFYGFEAKDSENKEVPKDNKKVAGENEEVVEGAEIRLTITPRADCQRGFSRWVKPVNHNHLRITRIIRSLRVLGLGGAARDFFDALMEVCRARGVVSRKSIAFWTRAMMDPLEIAPDGTVIEWLEDFGARRAT
ncbi:hypothetical protein GGR50DRAFT_695760 [Xylaria sp. CBS 124048]|nr:hypothetical protein GGR50DRAFT_695760 [Xylaria sp. CBS 124048]